MLKNQKKSARLYVLVLALVYAFVLISCAPKPHIEDFSPEKGPIGSTVTIDGKGFASTPAGNTVEFHGVAATDVTVVNTEKLVVKVPSGAHTGLISVQTSKGTSRSAKNFEVTNDPEWTFMIYLDADNNLEMAGITDFLEMASVGSSSHLNIVVQMDRIAGYTGLYDDWTNTRRFLIQNGDTPSSAPVQSLAEQNMGDPNVLRDFVEWGVTTYPAQNYALVIWNHGEGWRLQQEEATKKMMERAARTGETPAFPKMVASDYTDQDELYMREVQEALEAAKTGLQTRLNREVKLDIVGFDACLMGMLEVAYAIRHAADFMVASEESEPNNGWPYDTILSELSATPTYSPRDLASIIVTKYIESYPANSKVCQSALDLSELDNVCKKLNDFTTEANTEWDKVKNARLSTRHYYHTDGVGTWFAWGTDLGHFIDNVNGQVSSSTIKSAATALINSIDDFVVNERHTASLDGSSGVAIYFPPLASDFMSDPHHNAYNNSNLDMPVDFVKHYNWDEWLELYYANIP